MTRLSVFEPPMCCSTGVCGPEPDPELARFVVADLPGYGYAKASKAMKAQWEPLIGEYLDGSEQLRAVVLLAECRVLSDLDKQAISWLLAGGRTPIVVATKVDKLKMGERVRALTETSPAETAPLKRTCPVDAVENPSRPLSETCSAFSVALKAVLGEIATTPFCRARSFGVGRSATAGS